MKNSVFIVLSFSALLFLSISSCVVFQGKTNDSKVKSTFAVQGRCTMCKNTIESAAEKPDGVFWAEWDGELKQVTVKFDSTMVNIDDIERQIALAGYDTPNHKAEDDVYNSLPGCCKYERQ